MTEKEHLIFDSLNEGEDWPAMKHLAFITDVYRPEA